MSERRSTLALFLRGLKAMLGFLLGWWLLDRFLWPGKFGISWAVSIGSLSGLVDVALAYRRPEWRTVVAPGPVLGLGLLSFLILLVWLIAPQYTTHSFDLLHSIVVSTLLVPAGYLIVASVHQLRAATIRDGGAVGT